MNLFTEIKSAVSAKEAAIFYGLKVGRNGMACCPFHPDKHPSMKLDNRFHCFGCGADGDVINLVERIYGLAPLEAAKKLIMDFHLNIDIHTASNRASPKFNKNSEQELLRAFQLYKRDALFYSFALKDYLDNVRALLDSVTGDGPAETQGATRPGDECSAPTETEWRTPGNPSNVIVFPKKKAQNA